MDNQPNTPPGVTGPNPAEPVAPNPTAAKPVIAGSAAGSQPTVSGQQLAPAPLPPQNNGGKSSKPMLAIVIVIVALLIAGGLAVFALTGSKDDDSSATTTEQQDSAENNQPAINAVTADSLSDFDAVCENGSISNAAAFAEPYIVDAYYQNDTRRSWSSVPFGSNAPWAADYDAFEATNLVTCLSEKPGTATKSKTCTFNSGGSEVSIDYYALQYEATLYEAKSGKKVKDLGTVNGPAIDCPSFASYDRNDPKIYARPDAAALGALITTTLAEL